MDAHTRAAVSLGTHKKSVLLAYLLWWSFGFVGGHRSYLGDRAGAWAMLLLFIVAAVLAVTNVGLIGLIILGVWWLTDALALPRMVGHANADLIRRIA